MAVELATAYVSLVPSARGMRERIARELDIDAPAEKSGTSAGRRLTGALGSALKKSVVGIGVAAGAALSAALVKGWGRLTAIEDAQAKLAGLGHSATSVKTIMDNALASVRGTAFGLDEAATVAASAVAAGIKPGNDLRRVLGLVGDTASIAGSSMAEMGAIFNKVAASNRLSMAEVNQLADRGVPILQMLADQFGVTAAEMSKMVSQGKVDFAAFAQAIESNIGGAALESGNTTRGAFANMMAAAGRFGASLLEGVFPIAKQVFGGMITLIDGATDAVRPWAERFSEFVLNRVVPAARELMGDVGELAARVREFVASAEFQQIKTDTMDRLSSIFGSLATTARELGPSVSTIASSLGQATASIGISTWEVLLSTVDALARIANTVLVPAVQALAGWMERNQSTVTILVAAYGAWRLATLGVVAAQKAKAAVLAISAARTKLLAAATTTATVATKAWHAAAATPFFLKYHTTLALARAKTLAVSAATKVWAGVQWLLNAALTANPIGIIVVAIAALVAGIIIAYKRSEKFRAIVDKALRAVGAAAKWLWERAIKPAWEGIKRAFEAVATVVAWWWNNVTKPIFQTVFRIVKSFAALWWWLFSSAIRPVITAVRGQIQLVAKVITWLWRNVAEPAFRAIGAVAMWLWNNAIKPAVQGIASLAMWLWRNAIQPAFNGIIAAAKWLWERGIKPAFDRVRSIITSAWNNVIRPTFDKVMSIVERVRDTFRKAFNAIGGFISSAFDTAVSTVKGSINAVIRLINRAVGFINSNVIGNANRIPGVDFPTIPTIPELAAGGIIPATPGGRVVRVAEAGQAEAIIPLDKLDGMIASATAGPEVLELHLDLGEGISEVVRIKLREHDRRVTRRVRAGVGAAL